MRRGTGSWSTPNSVPGSGSTVFNGSTGTITAINHAGARVLLDDDRQVHLSATFIAGTRRDGTPNVSHGWARTVDGAQGGTWTQTHLLGTPTWTRSPATSAKAEAGTPPTPGTPAPTLTTPSASWPTAVAPETRSSMPCAEQSRKRWLRRTTRGSSTGSSAPNVKGTRRSPPVDPGTTPLSWTGPATNCPEPPRNTSGPLKPWTPPRTSEPGLARSAIYAAAGETTSPPPTTRSAEPTNDSTTPPAGSPTAKPTSSTTRQTLLNGPHWDRTHRWRLDRIAEIDHTLAHHWADVTLTAVRADDPLAFGADQLRAARATYQTDLTSILNGLPPDRRDNLDLANADLRQARRDLTDARRQVVRAELALDAAEQRRWGRRDRPAIEHATSELDAPTRTSKSRTARSTRRSNESPPNEMPSRPGTLRRRRAPVRAASSKPQSATPPPHSTKADPNASPTPPSTPPATCGPPSAPRRPAGAVWLRRAASPNNSKPSRTTTPTSSATGSPPRSTRRKNYKSTRCLLTPAPSSTPRITSTRDQPVARSKARQPGTPCWKPPSNA